MHRHLEPEELRALAAHALVGAAHSFSQAATADYRKRLGPPQVGWRAPKAGTCGLGGAWMQTCKRAGTHERFPALCEKLLATCT